MSILFDYLKQQNAASDDAGNLLNESHFDDNGAAIELLQHKLNFWKKTSLLLVILVLLIVVFGYAYLPKQTTLQTKQNQTSNSPNIVVETSNNPQNGQDNAFAEAALTEPSVATNENNKEIYKPVKREATTAKIPELKKNDVAIPTKPVNPAALITLGQLPEDLKKIFPDLQINSYVLSENPKDSFVILDGSLYEENQLIAPNLVLRQIKKEFMVVEFYGHQIKIPFN
ncbi:MAG: general secretion pathway protein GspB [Gammaproteobacteria bacterium]|nr:general secretion pathway protein GspB [Gammaproteobacteria bacterium]